MDYQRKRGETRTMAPRASTRKLVPVNEEASDTSYTEKAELKESTKLSDNVTTTLQKTPEVKPNVVYGVAALLLMMSIWHPYWALFAAIAVAIHKYSEDWEAETEDFGNVNIVSLLKSRKASEIPHSESDPDYLKGVYIARRNKQKIAKAITAGEQYCYVYTGWQDHPRDVRSGIAKELGLKFEDVKISSCPFLMEVWF
jgi:hypothetical protein